MKRRVRKLYLSSGIPQTVVDRLLAKRGIIVKNVNDLLSEDNYRLIELDIIQYKLSPDIDNSFIDINPEMQLQGTPYSIHSDVVSLGNFKKIQRRSIQIRQDAINSQRNISSQADEILGPYLNKLRVDLVSESNRIEGYDWTPDKVRNVVSLHKELMNGSIHNFVIGVKGDDRAYEALGLYKAHQIAEDWGRQHNPPREFEMRQLHSLIAAGTKYAGGLPLVS